MRDSENHLAWSKKPTDCQFHLPLGTTNRKRNDKELTNKSPLAKKKDLDAAEVKKKTKATDS